MQKEEISRIVREILSEMGVLGLPAEKPVSNRIRRPRSAPAVLNVFHAGVRKLEEALEQVRQIEDIAARSGVFTVGSARAWVCGEDVREKAGSRCILDTVKPEGLEKALQKADILVLPTFCFKTAAKTARLIGDDQETAIVLSALMQGKPVLATRDGFTLLDSLSNQGILDEIFEETDDGAQMNICANIRMTRRRFEKTGKALSDTRGLVEDAAQRPKPFKGQDKSVWGTEEMRHFLASIAFSAAQKNPCRRPRNQHNEAQELA